MRAVNILWDVDISDGIDALNEMTAKDAAEALGVPVDTYANMTTEEREDYAYDVFERSPESLTEFIGLPDTVEIPKRFKREESISDWLSDEYGFCHCGFELETID